MIDSGEQPLFPKKREKQKLSKKLLSQLAFDLTQFKNKIFMEVYKILYAHPRNFCPWGEILLKHLLLNLPLSLWNMMELLENY